MESLLYTSKLSDAKQEQQEVPEPSLTFDTDSVNNSTTVTTKIVKPTGCTNEELKVENCELREALEKSSTLITADKIASAEYSQNKVLHADILDFEFHLTKQQILDHIDQPYLSLKNGDLQIWFSGKIDKKSGHVILAKPGRISEPRSDRVIRGDELSE